MKRFMAIVTMLLASAGVSAGVISTYSSLVAYEAAIGPATETVETFTPTDHFPISTGILNSATNLPGIGIAPGDIQPGVTYSTPIGSSFFFNIDAGVGYVGGFLDGFYGGDPNRALTITFDKPEGEFGFNTNFEMGNNFDVTINFASGPAYAANFGVGAGFPFFGFQSSLHDINSVVIHGNGNAAFAFALDDFRFAGASNVPEPATLALLGLGLAGLGFSRRKQS